MKRIGTFLIAVALVVGMVGCGEVVYNGNGNGEVSYQLTVSSTYGGSVIEPGEGVHVYEQGTVVDLSAEPDMGYRFVNWMGDVGTIADVNASSTTITVDGDYSITADFEGISPGYGCFQLSVDWEYVDSLVFGNPDPSLPPATHVGVRIIYPEAQAVYMERTAREYAEEVGMISLEIPETDGAVLQLVVVHHPAHWTEPSYLHLVARVDDLLIRTGEITSLTLSSLNLTNPNPMWEFLDEWDGMNWKEVLKEETVVLPANETVEFAWRWTEHDPLRRQGKRVDGEAWIWGNLGIWYDVGWLDLGGRGDASMSYYEIPAHQAGAEIRVGFIIWVSGSDFGLPKYTYVLGTTVRDGDDAQTRWTFMFDS